MNRFELMQIDTHDKVGTGVGSCLAMIQAVINGNEVMATILLSALGALVGFLVTELFKWIKKRFF